MRQQLKLNNSLSRVGRMTSTFLGKIGTHTENSRCFR